MPFRLPHSPQPAMPPARKVRTAALALPPGPARLMPWLLAAATALLAAGLQAQVAINTNSAAPAGNAILDISSTNRGILVPRMTSSQRNSLESTAPAPAALTLDGLLVYQTDSVGSSPAGYYFYDNSTPIPGWKHIGWGAANWRLGGNTGTTNANFIGTLNNMPLVFKTNNRDQGRLTENGDLQLYSGLNGYPVVYHDVYPSPVSERVHVQGGAKLNGGSNGDHEGSIRFTPGSGNSPGKFEGYVVNAPAADPSINGWKQIDNNFGERKIQQSPIPGVGCQDPSNPGLTAAAVTAGPRPWPIPGPTTGFLSFYGPISPYYTFWEDGHRQYLYQANDLATAGICPGPSNPIRAIAFNVTGVGFGTGRIHFLRFRMKNTPLATAASFDMSGLSDFAYPAYPAGTPPTYPAGHLTGYTVTNGWNVHAYDQGGPGFVWAGGNLLIDASLDDQEWSGPSILDGDVQGYNSIPQSSISMFCDACGGSGMGTCLWQGPTNAPNYYYPPTTPTNGQPGTTGNVEGWGWVSGWNMIAGVNTVTCDGTFAYGGGGAPSVSNQLPRVAFLCSYTGGGIAYNVGSYMVAEEGVMIGDATWASGGSYPGNTFRGPGTISAQRSVWSDASLLSDYVFDLYYDGQVRPEDAQAAANYRRTPLKDFPNYVERERHLPTVDGREKWNQEGRFSVDHLTNQLWVTVEDQALYIQELNARMDALQQFLVEKKLKSLAEEQ